MLDARCEPYLQSLASKEKHTSQKKKKQSMRSNNKIWKVKQLELKQNTIN
jgi:hypothetical protein